MNECFLRLLKSELLAIRSLYWMENVKLLSNDFHHFVFRMNLLNWISLDVPCCTANAMTAGSTSLLLLLFAPMEG